MRQLNPAVVESIKKEEGLMLKVYDDATGKTPLPGTMIRGLLSIGYGRNLHKGISKDEANLFRMNDGGSATSLCFYNPVDQNNNPVRKGDTVNGPIYIGCGRNLTVVGISQPEAQFLLDNDLKEVQDALAKGLPWTESLDEVRYSAVFEWCYNMGLGGVLTFRNTLAALKGGDWNGAADGLKAWPGYKDPTMPGLKVRYDRLSNMVRTGDWQ